MSSPGELGPLDANSSSAKGQDSAAGGVESTRTAVPRGSITCPAVSFATKGVAMTQRRWLAAAIGTAAGLMILFVLFAGRVPKVAELMTILAVPTP